jgi:molybdate transport system ATP-binding protein
MINLDIRKSLFGADGMIDLDVHTTIPNGEFLTLYGPSGAGKTSIIRMIAGLMTPEKGNITINGLVWFDSQKKINLKPQKREIGIVFQEYSLFPNMTVYENLKFALPKGESPKFILDLLETIELENFKEKKPFWLSGGQKQRVALARALVRKPSILLLDEPLSALDSVLRRKLQEDILSFHQRFELTTIMISHDYHEVKKMSDRVIILEKGKIVNDGKPESVLNY